MYVHNATFVRYTTHEKPSALYKRQSEMMNESKILRALSFWPLPCSIFMQLIRTYNKLQRIVCMYNKCMSLCYRMHVCTLVMQ